LQFFKFGMSSFERARLSAAADADAANKMIAASAAEGRHPRQLAFPQRLKLQSHASKKVNPI
jgi:hypothetical protein